MKCYDNLKDLYILIQRCSTTAHTIAFAKSTKMQRYCIEKYDDALNVHKNLVYSLLIGKFIRQSSETSFNMTFNFSFLETLNIVH